MLEVGEFKGRVTGWPERGIIGDGLLSPRLARMHEFFDRLASRSAREQGIPEDVQANPGLYALWGRTTDGEVLGLHRAGGSWVVTRVPVPSDVVRSLNLPGVLEARDKLAWIEIGPNRVYLLRQAERIPIRPAQMRGYLGPGPRAPHAATPP